MLTGQAVVVPVGAPFAVRLSLGERMQEPEIIFTNGTIYTVDDEHPQAEAVAVRDGKFMEVGSAGDIERLAGPRTEVVDLGGAFAMPGFIDCHVHPAQPYLHEEGGALLFPVSFGRQQIADAVAGYLRRNPDVPHVIGERWALELFPNGRASKGWLDSLVSDRPALLRDESRHGAVANTAMLELAGITRDTPQPANGLIEKTPGQASRRGISRKLLSRLSSPRFPCIRTTCGNAP